MKILIIASLAYSLTNFRKRLLADLIALGHDVVACAPDADPEALAELSAMGVRFLRIHMDRTGTNPWRDVKTLLELRRVMRTEGPDVVLAYTQKPIIYGGLATRFSRTQARFFAMVSGLGHAFPERAGLRRALLRACVVNLYRHALARACGVFVFNSDDADELRRRHMIAPRQRVIQVPGSGIDLDLFARRPLPEGPPTFLLIARLMRDKGILEFCAAAQAIRARRPDARFQILGPIDANPSGIPRATLDHHLAISGVDYLGTVRDVRPLLAAAHVFVLPTYYREGLPRSILEAMAVGRAIVTTDTPGCRETVADGDNGYLVAPRDAAALAAALLRFVDDPALCSAMGASSRQMAEARFDVAIVNRILLGALLEPARDAAAASSTQRRALSDAAFLEALFILVGGALLLPAMIVVAILVAATLGRPLLFMQRRSGRGGETFRLVKFRTMRATRSPDGSLLPDAARVSRLGRWLRRLRVDELPELWNILRGEMALVGPRPLLPDTIAAMGAAGARRGLVRPGLTGWAQVNGNVLLSDHDRLTLDLWYIANRSIALDLRILWRTLRVIVAGERVNPMEIRRAHACAADRGG